MLFSSPPHYLPNVHQWKQWLKNQAELASVFVMGNVEISCNNVNGFLIQATFYIKYLKLMMALQEGMAHRVATP